MKRRVGYVSNSSSSSFCAVGAFTYNMNDLIESMLENCDSDEVIILSHALELTPYEEGSGCNGDLLDELKHIIECRFPNTTGVDVMVSGENETLLIGFDLDNRWNQQHSIADLRKKMDEHFKTISPILGRRLISDLHYGEMAW